MPQSFPPPPESSVPLVVPSPFLQTRPEPPRLHWGWLLAGDLLTRGLFGIVWLLVEAHWVRKVRGGQSKAYVWAILQLVALPLLFLLAVVAGFVGVVAPHAAGPGVLFGLLMIGFVVLRIGALFALRSELEESPINIPLSGVMTFFFGPIYFQYHLRDFEWQPTALEPDATLGVVS